MAKTTKATRLSKSTRRKPLGMRQRPVKAVKPNVISFRITSKYSKTLGEIYERDAASGIKSVNQLARKIVCDYLAGRLHYTNPEDKLQDLDIVGA